VIIVQEAILGAALGAVFALLGAGIVLVYRATGVLNFAHASMAMAAGFVNFELIERFDAMPVGVAAVISVLFGAALGVVLHRAVFIRLEGASAVTKVIVSIGVAGILQGIVGWVFTHLGTPTTFGRSLFPVSDGVSVAGAVVPWQRVAVIVMAAGATAGLALLVSRTELGIRIRALAQNPMAARLAGIDDRRVRDLVWGLSGASAALVGVLQMPFGVVSTLTFQGFQLKAFAAALLGGFASLPATLIGGLGLGVVGEIVAGLPDPIGGFAPAIAPLLVLVLLLMRVERFFVSDLEAKAVEGDGRVIGRGLRDPIIGTPRTWWAGAAAVAVATLALSGFWTFVTTRTVIYALLALSLVVLTGWSGQVSLMPGTFAGVGASLTWVLATTLGLPMVLVIPLAGLATIPVCAVVAVAALRLRPLYLAVGTLALAALFEETLFVSSWFANEGRALLVPRPEAIAGDRIFAAVVMLTAGACFAFVAGLARTRTGRALRSVRDNPAAAAAAGLNPVKYRLVAFVLSAFLAGISGSLLAYLLGTFSTELFSFLVLSLTAFGIAAVGGLSSPLGAVIGAFLLVWLTEVFRTSGSINDLTSVGVGVGIVVVMTTSPDGLAGLAARLRDRGRRRDDVALGELESAFESASESAAASASDLDQRQDEEPAGV